MADSAAEQEARRRAAEILAEEARRRQELADKVQRERDRGNQP